MIHLGQTRSAFRHDHLLQTPDTFVRTALPGLTRGLAIHHCGPASGAGFWQYTAEMESDGTLAPSQVQRFAYVIDGQAEVESAGALHPLGRGSYAYFPEQAAHRIVATVPTRLAIIEKRYQPLVSVAPPAVFIGREDAVLPQPLMGDQALQVRSLLPADFAFDFAVNTMTYSPGASLSMVEMHVMEHGLLMLAGEGIYKLSDCWYPVAAGDFIWMGAFCPQWFGALGKTPAKYLIYKDWNRSPLS